MGITLQDSTFRELRKFIYDRCGIHLADTKKYLLESRLIGIIREKNLNGFEDYLCLLRSNGNELERLYDAVTTNETFFFREPRQLDVFSDVVVPQLLKQKRPKVLKIWSAACSTGEEPYTIGMILIEKKDGARVELLASDISGEAVLSAKRGIYGSYSVRNVPGAYMNKYFSAKGDFYEIGAVVKGMVRFANINLLDEKKMRSIGGMDVIFCRNALIYFDDKAKQKAVSLLYDCLRPGGFLLIGSSESLHNVTRAFRPVVMDRVVVYQKELT